MRESDAQVPGTDMRSETAQLAGVMVLLVPSYRVVEVINIGVSDGIQDCQGQIGSIGGVQ